MATRITTTVDAYNRPLSRPNGRRLDVDSTGKRWAAVNDQGTVTFYYSTDGSSWTAAAGTLPSVTNGVVSFFIDIDDGFHCVYTNNSSTQYVYGTESGGTITWTTALSTGGTPTAMDVVAHKLGSDYYAHVAYAHSSQYITVRTVKITSGVPTWLSAGSIILSFLALDYSVSIDFRHTGDGKTVASSSPDLFVVYRYEQTVRFRKLVYSTGPTWSAAAYASLSTGANGSNYSNTMVACDGTRVLLVWQQNNNVVSLRERDFADTTTTSRGDSVSPGGDLHPSALWDVDGNVYIVGVDSASKDPKYIKWDRATTTWDSSWTTIETTTSDPYHVEVMRHHQASALEVVYSRDTGGSVYDVAWAQPLTFNSLPTAPTWSSPADGSVQDVAATLLLDWTFNDPNAGDTQSAYSLRRRIGTASYEYWNGSSWQSSEDASTKIAATGTSQTLATSWGNDSDADHYYAVKTWDAADAGPSPWATELRVVPSAKDNPTITTPLNFDTVAASETVTWTVASQTKYRVVVSDTSSTTNMDAGTLDSDSGLVISSGTRSVGVSFLTNGVTRYVRIQTYNDEGLLSDIVQTQVSVLYTPPNTPTLAMTTPTDAITITITNPAGGTAVVSNDLYRRDTGDAGNGIRIAAELAANGVFVDYSVASGKSYEYRVRALGDNASLVYGAWT